MSSQPKVISLPSAKPDSDDASRWEGVKCVRLIGGFVVMTVDNIARGKAKVVWHDESGSLCEGEFRLRMIEPVEFIDEPDAADVEAETAH